MNATTSPSAAQRVSQYLRALQTQITSAIAELDGQSLFTGRLAKSQLAKPYKVTALLKFWKAVQCFERAGCGFSHVTGPQSAALGPRTIVLNWRAHRFEAMGVSLVFHPAQSLRANRAHECAHDLGQKRQWPYGVLVWGGVWI